MDVSDSRPLERLLAVMARLRDPDGGCPWDLEQDFATIAPYTIEEAYEVADAIERGDMDDLKGELGDLLFQVVFHARMAEEAGYFGFHDVAAAIADKMIARHPHVFGAQDGIDSAGAQTRNWEAQKAAERAARAAAEGRRPSALDGVALGLPALLRAEKIQKRAARVGFDWPEIGPVLAKVREEIDELEAELKDGDRDRQADELGDVLFAVVNLARHLGIDPEAALRGTTAKFERRFHAVEAGLAAEGRRPEDATLEEMDAYWEAAKRQP
ncbi:MAG: nucleoside triphosphate pyrophosphohydrolase [Pseudomonadota bacterium]|nr:nucleoside triphosphate pyrophosphohydrolase [Pseudomonadota bacterium]